MRKDSWTKSLEKINRLQDKEEAKELKALSRGKRHTGRKIFIGFAVFFVLLFVSGYFYLDIPSWQPLNMEKLRNMPQTGILYDINGQEFGRIQSTQNRILVPLSSIPPDVRNAFLAAEDLRFYDHSGFDIVRIFSAVIYNLKSGSYSQGASTITQQLIKLTHLGPQKTLARKAEELYLAIQLEFRCSKDEILEMYLNHIYFGRGAYGIEAASQAYFGIPSAELSVEQGAALAAIIKAPSLYAPHLNPENNKNRREYILAVMYENDMLSAPDYQAALAASIHLIDPQEKENRYGWYTDAVLDEAETLLSVDADTLLSAGYRIYTCFDPARQDIMDQQFTDKNNFPSDASDGEQVQGAMACVDVNSGKVLAVVGGREYLVQRGLNRATQLRRQPGSALKPLAVFAPAIESHGYMTASALDDTPRKFGNYAPRNSGNLYYGNVSVRTALKNSLNVATVGLLQDIGIQSSRDYLLKVGIPLDDRDANLSLALGSLTYGVSPVQLAAAYAPFANGGIFYPPYFIEKIADADGRVIYTHQAESRRVLSPQSAYLMTSLLQTVTASGTGAKLSGAGTPVAGKTGTVNMTGSGNRDIWMAAYNSEIATACWMGFDKPDQQHKMQSWVSGGDYTAALSTKFYKACYNGKKKPEFLKADGIVWLKIDRKSIEWAGQPMLATSLTPKDYAYSEVFLSSNRPTRESNVWNAPRALSGFYVTHNSKGNPVLVMSCRDAGLYRIQRDAIGECIILNELYASAGETLYYTDRKAQLGVEYTYRIIPIHSELLSNGVLLEGKQSVQVARAKAPNSGSSLWDSLKDRLSVRETELPESTDALSLFWYSGD